VPLGLKSISTLRLLPAGTSSDIGLGTKT